MGIRPQGYKALLVCRVGIRDGDSQVVSECDGGISKFDPVLRCVRLGLGRIPFKKRTRELYVQMYTMSSCMTLTRH